MAGYLVRGFLHAASAFHWNVAAAEVVGGCVDVAAAAIGGEVAAAAAVWTTSNALKPPSPAVEPPRQPLDHRNAAQANGLSDGRAHCWQPGKASSMLPQPPTVW